MREVAKVLRAKVHAAVTGASGAWLTAASILNPWHAPSHVRKPTRVARRVMVSVLVSRVAAEPHSAAPMRLVASMRER